MEDDLRQVAELVRLHRLQEARQLLIEVLERDPGNDTAWVWMASIQTDHRTRQECYREALKHNPNNPAALEALQKMDASVDGRQRPASPQKRSILTHVLCGWPLVLIFFGGLTGGALGGLAYVLNLMIYNNPKFSPGLKIVLNLVVGMSAIGLWSTVAASLKK
jgi:hypothetical protein